MEALEMKYREITVHNEAILTELRHLREKLKKETEKSPQPNSAMSSTSVHSFHSAFFGFGRPAENSKLKPSPPNDFDGDRTKGRAFLSSCELYFQLAPDQFVSEDIATHWALSFMKTGSVRATLLSGLHSGHRHGDTTLAKGNP
jgi:hypothetical protein